MAGIFPDMFGPGAGDGVLPFGAAPSVSSVIDGNRNAILGYLAGALQGGNLGQSIGRGR
jgi:outer membrane lipoprotein SlyB